MIAILSIDSIVFKRVIQIIVSIHSDKKDVKQFINELKEILTSHNFDIDNNILFISSSKSGQLQQYSTPFTMNDLGYDVSDVVEHLKQLTVAEYCHTLIDKEDNNPPLLYVFGKNIEGKQVYIKLKIKGTENKKVLCLSFHYASRKMEFPYT